MAEDKTQKPIEMTIQTPTEKLIENSYPKSDKPKPTEKKDK